MKDNINSIVVLKTYWESIREFPSEQQLILWNSIFDYSFNDVEPELTGLTKSIWISIKPTIDSSMKRYKASVENGKKGGAPKGNNNAKKQPTNNLQTTQEQPENNLKGSLDKQPTINLYKDKDKDKDKDMDKDLYSYKDVNNDFFEIDITEGVNDDLFEDWLKTKQVL